MIALLVAACGGGSSSSRATNPPPPPPPPTTVDAAFDLAAFQVPGGGGAGTASADLTINLDDGTVTGTVTINGITAVEVRLSEGFAGELGTLIAALTDNGGGEWAIPDSTVLSAAQLDLLDQGGLFVEVTTVEFPDGELRGQILVGNQQIFVNVVEGAQEIPPVESSASGFAGVTLNADDGSVIVHVTATGLDDAVAGHVHTGFAGTNGGVLIELAQDANDPGHWQSPADATLDAAGQDALLAGELYINLHTPDHPPGELRGQILSTEFELVLVDLSGEEEVPMVDTDAVGYGALTLNRDTAGLELHITALGLNDANAGHVHMGFAGTNGGVDIELEQDPSNVEHWLAPAATVLDADQLARLDAGEWYLNLHTPDHPGGEVRGQIAPEGIDVIVAALDGAQEVPAVVSTASGVGGLTLNRETLAIELHITTDGADDAAAAHIHQAFAGANGGVLVELEQDPNDVAHWAAPAGTTLDEAGLTALGAGELYLNVHTPANPGGEVRGQLVPDNVTLLLFPMTGAQSVPPVVSAGGATGAVTVNRGDYTLAANINAVDLDDAVAAHIHSGLAGDTGPVEIDFAQDATDVTRWTIDGGTPLDDALQTLFNSGALYLNLHTPANPAGEVRGQLVPDGIEVVFTGLSEADVNPPSGSAGSGVAATTIDEDAHVINTNVNLSDLDDADAVQIRQAPVMQNGPNVFDLNQDATETTRWRLVDQMLDDAVYLALRNRGLYVQATTPTLPNGAVRGQIEPERSDPPPAGAFQVVAVQPTQGSSGESPAEIIVNFNRDPLASSVDGAQFELLGSGSDGGFTEGNEVAVMLPAPDLDGATVSFDLSATTLAEDTYRVRIDPESGTALTDGTGAVLDGDGDGNPGGAFVSTFEVVAAPPPPATLTDVQTQIFTPSCALSGCHTGASPAQGMDLSDGQAFSNIVGVPSAQNASLDRIEPGDPDNSYLVQKVEGTASGGGRMPLGQPPLSNDLIQLLRSWVADGAQDN